MSAPEDRRALARRTKPIPCYAVDQIPAKHGGEQLYASLANAVETGRAKGKVVTVVRGLSGKHNDLAALLSRLKNACGAGGKIEEDNLELQGDQLERVRDILREIGYRV